MDETKALNTLSLVQKLHNKEGASYQALQLAMDDIALVMNILFIYNEYDGEDYLYLLDDIIKAFIEQRRTANEDSKHR